MGRNLSSVLRKELANLDKDADSHKSAMKALKSYVKELDSNAIPAFLVQVSETRETGSLSGEYTISLFEVLARARGADIVPHIDNIMSTIVKTLASSAGSFPLQQACSKVVSAIARYGIDPATPGNKRTHIIQSLCKPLSDSLLALQESLSSGAALCLKALVDCDNWRAASDEMVNKVCQNVAVALGVNSNSKNSYMALVMALGKHNPFIVEAYARLFVHSGLRILDSGVLEDDSQKRLLAIQMLNFLMKNLESRSLYSETELILQELEKCQSDKMHFVKMAAYEAMQTARKIAGEKSCGSVTSSNFTGKSPSRKNLISASNQPNVAISHESQPFHYFFGHDSLVDSPRSVTHAPFNLENDRWSVNCKPSRHKNGRVDEDGLCLRAAEGSNISNSPLVPYGEYTDEFTGFQQASSRDGLLQSVTPSPQRSRSLINVDDTNISTPTSNLIDSHQDPDYMNSELQDKPKGSFGSRTHIPHGFVHDIFEELKANGELHADGSEQNEGAAAESVSSTGDVPADTDIQEYNNEFALNRAQTHTKKGRGKTAFRLALSFLSVILAGFASIKWIYVQDEVYYPVPT